MLITASVFVYRPPSTVLCPLSSALRPPTPQLPILFSGGILILLMDEESERAPTARGQFASTHWSVVLAAAGPSSERAHEALAQLCRTYWYPVYFYVRRLGHQAADAQDLTQAFFARVLEKRYITAADPDKGRFRSFLLTALKGFLANEWDRANRQKRGGGQTHLSLDQVDGEGRYLAEPQDDATLERVFEKRWALTLLEQAVHKLEQEFANTGRQHLFAALKPWISGDGEPTTYATTAAQLEMTEGALRVMVHRLRQRYRELLRSEIAQTVDGPEEIDEEIRYLFAALA